MYHPAMEPCPVSCSSFVPLLRRMSYLILKRGFDLVFSLVLLVTCALLMAVIALVVWLDWIRREDFYYLEIAFFAA